MALALFYYFGWGTQLVPFSLVSKKETWIDSSAPILLFFIKKI